VEVSCSEAYPEGIPSEQPVLIAHVPRLPASSAASIDPNLARTVIKLAEAKDIEPAFPSRVPDVPVNSHFKPFTKVDIERAKKEWRKKKARQEYEREKEQQNGDKEPKLG